MDDSAYAERRRLGGKPLLGTAEDGMPAWLKAKMLLLHCIVSDDYESLLLARLCAEEASSNDARKRPLTVGEIVANWSPDFAELLMARYGLRESEAKSACAETRATWMEEDSAGWHEAHGQGYPSVMAQMREALLLARPPCIYILTARERTHAQQLLRRNGVELDDENIFGGLSSAAQKASALVELRASREQGAEQVRFIDDDAEVLRDIANDSRLFSSQLFFASWGYSQTAGEATVASMPRVRSLGQSNQLEVVLGTREEEAGPLR